MTNDYISKIYWNRAWIRINDRVTRNCTDVQEAPEEVSDVLKEYNHRGIKNLRTYYFGPGNYKNKFVRTVINNTKRVSKNKMLERLHSEEDPGLVLSDEFLEQLRKVGTKLPENYKIWVGSVTFIDKTSTEEPEQTQTVDNVGICLDATGKPYYFIYGDPKYPIICTVDQNTVYYNGIAMLDFVEPAYIVLADNPTRYHAEYLKYDIPT